MLKFLGCFLERQRIAPAPEALSEEEEDQKEDTPKMNPAEIQDQNQKAAGLTTLPNNYEIYQSIGMGCFGAANILLAQHKPNAFFVVLRVVDLERLTGEQMEEVQEEMKLSQMLSHANIACYHCCFVVRTKLWAVQTLMHYGSCADIMHSAEPFKKGFKENVIAVILRDVVQALNYLHGLNFVHRSVRAKHFLISESGVVKLTGLRSMVSLINEGVRTKSLHGHYSGTVDNICWLAPEVLAQNTLGYSEKSDVYSVGIAALELVTGEAPFAGLPVTEIMMLKLRGNLPVLMRRQEQEEDTVQNLSTTFRKVVDMCVHPNPYFRPPASKLLHLSFLKIRKKSVGAPSLNDLLKPVVPLDTAKLSKTKSSDAYLESLGIEQLSLEESSFKT